MPSALNLKTVFYCTSIKGHSGVRTASAGVLKRSWGFKDETKLLVKDGSLAELVGGVHFTLGIPIRRFRLSVVQRQDSYSKPQRTYDLKQ